MRLAGVTWFSLVALGLLATPLDSAQPRRHNRIIELLSQDKVVFGWFSPARTPDAAARAANDASMDFVFLNMEQPRSYDPQAVGAFLRTMAGTGGRTRTGDHPLMARLPIFHADPDAARARVAEILDLGVHAVVFPGMETPEEGQQALAAMRYPHASGGRRAEPAGVRPDRPGGAAAHWGLTPAQYKDRADVYPINPNGELAAIFIVESVKGIENSRAITRLRPTVMIPGPGTLRRVFDGDMSRVEAAIQTQLASCKEFEVPCGITANAADVARRIQEGFRMIIIYDRDYPETIKAGRAAAGRN
jgi:4-hydroxy-2-oxoheptanedioate aldolase